MQETLKKFYRSIAPELIEALPSGRQISCPIFLSVRAEYETAKRRLLLVGQETHSWYGSIDVLKSRNADPVTTMQSAYEAFGLGQSYGKSFFCSVMHNIQKKLEPFVPPLGFLWSNLFTCDENRRTPTNEIGDILRKFRVLPNEIKILRPHAVIFLTGPIYDYTIKNLFCGCTFESVSADIPIRQLATLKHNDLPPLTFRTYHPNSLKRQKKLDYLDVITSEVRNAWLGQE